MMSAFTAAVHFELSSVMFFASSKGIKRLQSYFRVITFPLLSITRTTAPLTLLSLPVISSCITPFFHRSRGNLSSSLIMTMLSTMSLLNESYFFLLYVWCSRKLFIYSRLNRFQKRSVVVFKYYNVQYIRPSSYPNHLYLNCSYFLVNSSDNMMTWRNCCKIIVVIKIGRISCVDNTFNFCNYFRQFFTF